MGPNKHWLWLILKLVIVGLFSSAKYFQPSLLLVCFSSAKFFQLPLLFWSKHRLILTTGGVSWSKTLQTVRGPQLSLLSPPMPLCLLPSALSLNHQLCLLSPELCLFPLAVPLISKTSQELRMLSSVTLNFQVTRLSWIQFFNCQKCNQCLKCHKSQGLSLSWYLFQRSSKEVLKRF